MSPSQVDGHAHHHTHTFDTTTTPHSMFTPTQPNASAPGPSTLNTFPTTNTMTSHRPAWPPRSLYAQFRTPSYTRPDPSIPLSPIEPTNRVSGSKPVDTTRHLSASTTIPTDTENLTHTLLRRTNQNRRVSNGLQDGSGSVRNVSGGARGLAPSSQPQPTAPKRSLEDPEPAPPPKRHAAAATESHLFPSHPAESDQGLSDDEYLSKDVRVTPSAYSTTSKPQPKAHLEVQKAKAKGKTVVNPASVVALVAAKRRPAARGTSTTARSIHDGAVRCTQVDMRQVEFLAGRVCCRHPTHPLYDPLTHFSAEAYAQVDLTKNGVQAMGPVLEQTIWESFTDLQKRMLAAQSNREQIKGARMIWNIFFTDFVDSIRPIEHHCQRCADTGFPCMARRGNKDGLCLGCHISKGKCFRAPPHIRYRVAKKPWEDFRLWVHRLFGVTGLGDHIGHIAWEANLPPVPRVNPFERKVAEAKAKIELIEGDEPAKPVGQVVEEVASQFAEIQISTRTQATTKSKVTQSKVTTNGKIQIRSRAQDAGTSTQPFGPTAGPSSRRKSTSISQTALQSAQPGPSKAQPPVTGAILLRIPARQAQTPPRDLTDAATLESFSLPTQDSIAAVRQPAYSSRFWNASPETHTGTRQGLGGHSRRTAPPSPVKEYTNANALVKVGWPTVPTLFQVEQSSVARLAREPTRELVHEAIDFDHAPIGDEDEPNDIGEPIEIGPIRTYPVHDPPPLPDLPASLRSREAVMDSLLACNITEDAYTVAWQMVRAHVRGLAAEINLKFKPQRYEPLYAHAAWKALEAPFTQHLLEKPALTVWMAIQSLGRGDYASHLIGPLACRLAPDVLSSSGEVESHSAAGGQVLLLGAHGMWGTLLVQGTKITCYGSKAWERKFTRDKIVKFLQLGPSGRVSYPHKVPNLDGTPFALWAFEQLAANTAWVPRGIDGPFLLALRKWHALVLADDQDIALAMAEKMRGNVPLIAALVKRAGLK